MDRFVAMIWDRMDLARGRQVEAWSEALQQRSTRWVGVLDAPGVRVFSYHHRGDGPVVTRWDEADGVAIGPLFSRGNEKGGRLLKLSSREAARVIATQGEALIESYWGNYVAIWFDRAEGRVAVLRDPCGAVPCFMTLQRGVHLFFGHAEDVADLEGVTFSIDWTFLQAFVLHEYFVTKFTGLREAEELLSGQRVVLGSNGEKVISWVWNGASIAASPDFRDFQGLARLLRETMESSFIAWGKEYRNVVVMLSGGLDSSIVANLLRRTSDAKITCLHYLGASYEQYEVKLARLAAKRAGVELIEVEADLRSEDVSRALDVPRLARPATETIAVLADKIAMDAAQSLGADAFMTGQAGDTLFLQRGAAEHTLADYCRLNPLGGEFGRISYDAATLRRTSIWAVVRETLENRAWRPHAFLDDPEVVKRRALAPGTERSIPQNYRRHPWTVEASRLPPGKARHVNSIIALSRFYAVRGHGLLHDVISAFYCQPIAEFVLRVPTYMFCETGLDRALQRRAFGDLIPEEIVRRTSKGGIGVAAHQGMRTNLKFFRSLILDGELARQGWLERSKIEGMLSEEGVTRGEGPLFIYQLAAVEVWLRTWRFDSARVAA